MVNQVAQYQDVITIPLYLAPYTSTGLYAFSTWGLDTLLTTYDGPCFPNASYIPKTQNLALVDPFAIKKMTLTGTSGIAGSGTALMNYKEAVVGITTPNVTGWPSRAISFNFVDGANQMIAANSFISNPPTTRSYGPNNSYGMMSIGGQLYFATIATVFSTQYSLLAFSPSNLANNVLANDGFTTTNLNTGGYFVPDLDKNVTYYIYQVAGTYYYGVISGGAAPTLVVAGLFPQFSLASDQANFTGITYIKPTFNGWFIVLAGDKTRWLFVNKDWTKYWVLNFNVQSNTIPARPGTQWNASFTGMSISIVGGIFYFTWNDGINTTHFANSYGANLLYNPVLLDYPLPVRLNCIPYINACEA